MYFQFFVRLALLALLTVLETAPLSSKAQEPNLLKIATRSTTFKKVQIRHFIGNNYCWLSSGRVLLVRQNGHAVEKLYVHDVATGKETFLSGLTHRFRIGAGLTNSLEAAQNGKMVFWINEGEDDANPDTFGAGIDGLKHFRIKATAVPTTWLPSGDSLLTLTNRDASHAAITLYKTTGKDAADTDTKRCLHRSSRVLPGREKDCMDL